MQFLFRMITGQYRLVWIVSFVYSALFNFAFFRDFTTAFPLDAGNWGFFISVCFFLFAVHIFVFSLLAGRLFTKLVLSLGFLIGASAAYFSWTYGIVIDTVMLQNILETDTGEAFGLFSIELVAAMIIGALLPIYLVWKAPVATKLLAREPCETLLHDLCTAYHCHCISSI